MLPFSLVLTSAWLVGGAYLDGWAHSHGKVDSFFTVWHALLYSGYAANAAVLLGMLWRHRPTGRSLSERVPSGYGLSILGAVVFGAAGLLDMGWHLVFGIEIGTAALLSPTHLLLFVAAGLMVAGPLCAAWSRPHAPRGWSGWLPVLASLTFVYATSNFATQFAHPLALPAPGTFASYLPGGTDVQIVGADGGAQTRLPRREAIDKRQPSWSPDGTRLAVIANNREDHTVALSVVNLPLGDEHVVLSADESHAPMMPKWSPDGEVLAFVARGDSAANLYVARVDGSQVRQVTTSGVEIAPMAWSPDGEKLAFSAERDGRPWIYVVDIDGSDLTPVTEGVGPSWSPDGTRLVFGSDVWGNGEIYTVQLDGGDRRQLTWTRSDLVRAPWSWAPAWSPDGRQIAFQSNRSGTIDVYVMDIDSGRQTNVSDNPNLDSLAPTWSPDGRQIAFTVRGHGFDPFLNESLGVASILLQVVVLVMLVLLMASHWRLPFGTFTAALTINATLLSVLADTFPLILGAAAAGLAIDVLLARSGQLDTATASVVRLVGTTVPALYFGIFLTVLAVTEGLGWSPPLWVGALVLATGMGFALTYLYAPPRSCGVHGRHAAR